MIYNRVGCFSHTKGSTVSVSLSYAEMTTTNYLFYQAGWEFWVFEGQAGEILQSPTVTTTPLIDVHNTTLGDHGLVIISPCDHRLVSHLSHLSSVSRYIKPSSADSLILIHGVPWIKIYSVPVV